MVSTYYLLVRIATRLGIGEMHKDQTIARQCFLITAKMKGPVSNPLVESFNVDLKSEIREIRGESTEPLIIVPLERDPEKIVQIGAQLNTNLRKS